MSVMLGAWSIKGVDEEAKSIAKRAAAEAGVTMGVWLESAIFHIADRRLEQAAVTAPKPAIVAGKADDGKRLFNTTIRLSAPAESGNIASLQSDMKSIVETIRAVEENFAVNLAALESRLAAMEDGLLSSQIFLPKPQAAADAADNPKSAYQFDGISASYQPLVMADAVSSNADRAAGVSVLGIVLHWAILLALGFAAFLVGQRLGLNFPI